MQKNIVSLSVGMPGLDFQNKRLQTPEGLSKTKRNVIHVTYSIILEM